MKQSQQFLTRIFASLLMFALALNVSVADNPENQNVSPDVGMHQTSNLPVLQNVDAVIESDFIFYQQNKILLADKLLLLNKQVSNDFSIVDNKLLSDIKHYSNNLYFIKKNRLKDINQFKIYTSKADITNLFLKNKLNTDIKHYSGNSYILCHLKYKKLRSNSIKKSLKLPVLFHC